MSYFTFGADSADAASALRRAWDACGGVSCPRCQVSAGQYCRDKTAGIWYVTRPHRARQDAAGVPAILAPVGIRGSSWATQKGSFRWSSEAPHDAA